MSPFFRSGFSLIEILVSLFVLSVGVLAAVGLHISALQTAQQSALHTRAVHLAVDLAETLRGDVRQTSGTMDAWLQRVRDELPGGRAHICHDAAPWDAAVRQLRWDCLQPNPHEKAPLVIKIGWYDKTVTRRQDAPRLVLAVAAARQ